MPMPLGYAETEVPLPLGNRGEMPLPLEYGAMEAPLPLGYGAEEAPLPKG